MFEIVNLTTDSPGKESMGYLNSYDGYDDMCITCSFYQFLKEDPKDIRLKLLSFDKKYYAYVNKYQPQREENIEDANILNPSFQLIRWKIVMAADKPGDIAGTQ